MRWLPRPQLTRSLPILIRAPRQLRHSSSASDFRVHEVPCGSSGSIPISYAYPPPHRAPANSPASTTPRRPPSHSSSTSPPSHPPRRPPPASPPLRPYPTAIIHYRWSPSAAPSPSSPLHTPLHWPTPLHDVSFAYAHLLASLSPPFPARRAIYLLSSHLGAPLATSLALTESHPHRPFAVRGLAVHNGVYNWTMFLPDHRAHRDTKGGVAEPDRYGCEAMAELGDMMPGLFKKTDNLFDPFASPALFFRTAGLEIPPSFTRSSALEAQIDHLASHDDGPVLTTASPRRAALVFPPRGSTLKIPETLLMYTRARRKGRARARGNTFETQALGLAGVMRRSVEREVRERRVWDDEVGEDVPGLRVRTHDLGMEDGGGLGTAEGAVAAWLEEKFGF